MEDQHTNKPSTKVKGVKSSDILENGWNKVMLLNNITEELKKLITLYDRSLQSLRHEGIDGDEWKVFAEQQPPLPYCDLHSFLEADTLAHGCNGWAEAVRKQFLTQRSQDVTE